MANSLDSAFAQVQELFRINSKQNPKFTYEGEFENGELEGYGILTQDSGVYEGNFKKALKEY